MVLLVRTTRVSSHGSDELMISKAVGQKLEVRLGKSANAGRVYWVV